MQLSQSVDPWTFFSACTFKLPGMGFLFFGHLLELSAASRQQTIAVLQKEKQSCSQKKAEEHKFCTQQECGLSVFIQIFNALVIMVFKHDTMGLKQEQGPGAVVST